jgi:hypothetical protein
VVGDIEIRTDSELTLRQIKDLLSTCAGIALVMAGESEEEARPTISLGFTTEIAQVEEIDLSEYFEESP